MISGANPLLLLAIVLISGSVFGTLAKQVRLPRVTGQILAGILLGPVTHLVDAKALASLQPVTHFALGLMAVAVGSHLLLHRLRNALKRLLILVAFEAILTPLLVLAVVLAAPGTGWVIAILLAAIAISTAPATTLAIVKDTHSKGVFVKTLLAAVALNNIACISLFELAHTMAGVGLDPERGHTVLELALAPFREIALSALVGAGIAVALIAATRNVVRSDRLTAASLVAILVTAGIGETLDVSTLLSCLFLGMALANLTPEKEEIGHEVFANFEYAIFTVFFTLAGAELHFEYLVPGGVLALLVFFARGAGKLASGYLAMRYAGATRSLRRWLGPALLPQAGLAVGLMLLVTEDPAFAAIRDLFLAVVLTVVTLNELLGPLLVRTALRRSGDYGKDRARLIDFLQEENIVLDLEAATKEEAIARLAAVLVKTRRVGVDRDALVEAVLARERLGSTCLGAGLAVPHADLPGDGDEIVGVMGLSRRGLAIPTPDGVPVHCMVLLATPAAARDHHLEVLAALARTIHSDQTVRQQLYRAKSPAHAYELLHANEASEDWNYFLEAPEGIA